MFNQENNMNLADRKEVDKIIKNNLKGNFSKKLGDTPTDALQLANKAYVDSKATIVYSGYINSNGTAGTPFPTGWSVAHTATGKYTVTHNLGNTNYVVVGFLVNSGFGDGQLLDRSANTFEVGYYNFNGVGFAFIDADNTFIVKPS